MGRWHNVYLNGHFHFCTATVLDWRALLVGDSIQVLYEEWEAARDAWQMRILAYVVMPNHFHLILYPEQGDSVSRFLQRFLTLTSRRLQPGGGFWKERPRVLPLHSENALRVKINYLHDNPVRKGLAPDPADWLHSSYRQLILGRTDVEFRCDPWEYLPIQGS